MCVCVCVCGGRGEGGGRGIGELFALAAYLKKKKAVGVLRNVSNVQITVSDKSMPMRNDIITMWVKGNMIRTIPES